MVAIGLENKSINNLLYEREINQVDFFTYNALNGNVKDLEKTSYATLPGIIGYLYLSGSKTILFLGCFFFVFIIIFIESIILRYTDNYLLSTYVAISLSSSIAGFGIDIMSWIKVQLLTIFIVFLIYYILTKFLKREKN